MFAIGGGGDIATATALSAVIEEFGVKTVLASIAWERYINDPVPGPVEIESIKNAVHIGNGVAVINGDSYAVRNGRKVVFQAARVARVLNRSIYILDLYSGVTGLHNGLLSIMEKEKVDYVIGVDVGGDSLALGCEDNLWSPLADWMGVSALSHLNGILAVHSPGSDGELSQSYVLARIDELATRGALIGVKSMCSREAELLDKLLGEVYSEASMVPLLAYRGIRGRHPIRSGSRYVDITLLSTLTFFLDSRIVAESNPLIKSLGATRSIHEARAILNEHGVYTELDLEEDLHRAGISPDKLSSEILREVRERGLKRLRETAGVKGECGGAR